ncbi:VOC family protein [Pusillimonas sp. ANT_WB101]|uniref:VOC family protein n=1 Tax=Pusillimonas sp. ANT_WB101 TaxID=2597356 RepID=UPI002105C405|nr:VOC family protein [Pusillimonas sp. ANT_WB101]
MKTLHPKSAPAPFDHLVLMMRDQLMERAPHFEQDGYRLTELSVHNLGSINRLIPLDTTYIELLGWPAGKPPARKEIAEQPLGLDALVFKTENAQATFERLREEGFEVNPVLRLERPLIFQGKQHLAQFDTVRFSAQPVAGLRMYFCQHLTPEFVWNEDAIRHDNGAKSLDHIVIEASDAQAVAAQLGKVANAEAKAQDDGTYVIALRNMQLVVRPAVGVTAAKISQAFLRHADDELREFNPHVSAASSRQE